MKQEKVTVYNFMEDTGKFIRNPAMGWMLYIDGFGSDAFPKAEEFWNSMDDYVKYASIFYVRIPWSQVEPEEGIYAWKHDENFKNLIEMALERNLKLAFRIYVDGRHGYQQSTPQYVKALGCDGYIINPGNGEDNMFWTPYVYDSIFQDKFSVFVKEFAREFDNPDKVAFIDAQGLGWWGEMHNIDYLTDDQKVSVFTWITNLYMDNFKKVLLGDQYGANSFPFELHDSLLNKGWIIRRDSFGSPVWFQPKDKSLITANWPKTPVFAENCYHHFVTSDTWWRGDGFETLRDCMLSVLSDAVECHANTLDLRIEQDAQKWCVENTDLVQEYSLKLGYRFVIEKLNYLYETKKLISTWKNTGIGKLPNSSINWNGKYRLAYALYCSSKKSIVFTFCDKNIDPGTWINGETYQYESSFTPDHIAPGVYTLLFAIVDKSKDNLPSIEIAITSDTIGDNWYIAGEIQID